MTRINVGIAPHELIRQHLLAEHREIKRIPNAVAAGRYNLGAVPEEFCLGRGHVAFFYNKLLYLRTRYWSLYLECRSRGYRVENFIGCWRGVPPELMNDYEPTERDRQIVSERIMERIQAMYSNGSPSKRRPLLAS